jgi:hypothetical protein
VTPISYESDLTERLKKLAKQSARPLGIVRTVIRGRSLGEVRLTLLVVAGLASVAMIATGALLLPVIEQPDQSRPPTSLSLTPASSENIEGEFDALPSGWTSLSKPPEVRTSAAIAWTGRELFVWGGYVYEGFGDDVPRADGFAYDASADRWEELPSSPLDPRVSPAAAWTGQEMLVWGGDDDRGSFFMDGAAYNPSTGRWRLLPAAPISARSPLSVWSGSELIVWGTRGQAEDDSSDGAAYDPSANTLAADRALPGRFRASYRGLDRSRNDGSWGESRRRLCHPSHGCGCCLRPRVGYLAAAAGLRPFSQCCDGELGGRTTYRLGLQPQCRSL